MTTQELIAQIEGELEANREKQLNLRNHVQAVIDTARQEGRANLTESDAVRTEGLFKDIEAGQSCTEANRGASRAGAHRSDGR